MYSSPSKGLANYLIKDGEPYGFWTTISNEINTTRPLLDTTIEELYGDFYYLGEDYKGNLYIIYLIFNSNAPNTNKDIAEIFLKSIPNLKEVILLGLSSDTGYMLGIKDFYIDPEIKLDKEIRFKINNIKKIGRKEDKSYRFKYNTNR